MNEHAHTFASSACCRAVVTGAADGVGASCARELAKLGARVALIDIDRVMALRLGAEIGAEAHVADVLSERHVKGIAKALLQDFGQANVIVNAAGAGFVRSLGMLRVTRAISRTAGNAPMTVINVAPRKVRRGDPFQHASSKVAFQRLSQGLRGALEKPNLNVLTVDAQSGVEGIIDIIRQICRPGPMNPRAGLSDASGAAA